MKRFIKLFAKLDETNSTNKKLQAIMDYLVDVPASDAIWAVFFLSGNRFKRFISGRKLYRWAREYLDWPKWMLEEAYIATGDTAEAIALAIDTSKPQSTPENNDRSLADWIFEIKQLAKYSEHDQKSFIHQYWNDLDDKGIFILNKILTGAFRVGVSKLNTARAISKLFDLEKTTIQHRLMGTWDPTPEFYEKLISKETLDIDRSRPYPFFLASQLDDDLETLGKRNEWIIEWKWDGIRGQLVKRENQVFLWSRGEEIVNVSFPEIIEASEVLPDGLVLDGEVLAYHQGKPLAFSVLQRRIGRENVTDEIREAAPVIFMIYDVMEYEGNEVRQLGIEARRSILKNIFSSSDISPKFKLSPIVEAASWEDIKEIHKSSREHYAEGFMMKRLGSTYQVGRKRGDWWKLKVDPMSLDCVLVYAQSGSGRRASLFTDLDFAVWDNDELVRIGSAYSGLTDEEIKELDNWIRRNTVERFGPVRRVDPVQVFEIGFDGIMSNERSKSGVSFRFPRILRWRKDKVASEANSLQDARDLLKYEGITEIKRDHSIDDFF